jgi:hypothetical protein
MQVVHESGGILPEHRDIGNLLDLHHGRSEIDCQLMGVRERAGTRVNIDHGHGSAPISWTMMIIIVEQTMQVCIVRRGIT